MTKRKKDDRLRVRTSGICIYCLQRPANQMIQLKVGSSDGSPGKRWMCGMCILKRQRMGIIKEVNNAYVREK